MRRRDSPTEREGPDRGITHHGGMFGRLGRLLTGFLVLVVALSLASPVGASQQGDHPLEPPDTSSPRATLQSFVTSMDEVYREYRGGGSSESIARYFRRAVACLDLRDVPASLHGDVGGYSVLLLKEILDRIPLPDSERIPGLQDANSAELAAWTIPMTEITITIRRVAEGEHQGQFLFSPRTVSRLIEFHERARHLPYKQGASADLLALYYDNPGGMVPLHWAEWLPRWSKVRLLERPLWKWLALLAFVCVAVAVTLYTHRLVRRWDRRLARRSIKLASLVLALGVGLWAWTLDVFVDDVIGLRGPIEAVIK